MKKIMYFAEFGQIIKREILKDTPKGFWVKSRTDPVFYPKQKSYAWSEYGPKFNSSKAFEGEAEAKSYAKKQIISARKWVQDKLQHLDHLDQIINEKEVQAQ